MRIVQKEKKPTKESTLELILKRLKEKRVERCLPEDIKVSIRLWCLMPILNSFKSIKVWCMVLINVGFLLSCIYSWYSGQTAEVTFVWLIWTILLTENDEGSFGRRENISPEKSPVLWKSTWTTGNTSSTSSNYANVHLDNGISYAGVIIIKISCTRYFFFQTVIYLFSCCHRMKLLH